MDGWTSEEGLRWRPLAPFGVEIDCDLSQPLTPERTARLAELLAQGGYLLARGQALTMAQQTALMEPIGPIIRRPQENGYISTDAGAPSSRTELSFHADAAYTEAPFAAISLHAVDVVDEASGTRFVNAEHAYATLPEALRARLDAACAEMISPVLEGVGVRACDTPEPGATQRAKFPAVRLNPRTGRPCIGVSEMHTARLTGMDWKDSRALLGEIYDHLYAPERAIEHRWRRGDIVLWDNLTLQHARGSLESAGRRVLQRVVAGA
jgi:taurine dioxygenase